MAYYGKVLYLMDDRYMDLQDVYDNIQPLPTLIPTDEYKQNVVVYQTSTSHEITLGIIQDLTSHRGIEAGEELWAWFAQWEVEGSEPPRPMKKPRVWPPAAPHPSAQQEAATTILERRILHPSLMQEEDMMRILIDIVQVDSSLVPNFIEFLYRWVDFFEGDGMALKGALKGEIPSLWDFEFHPLVLPKSMQKATGAGPGDSTKQSDADDGSQTAEYNPKVEEVAMSSPTKRMRSKPNLAALERQTLQTEESERLQYREVKFGIQPPRLKERLPPLINIPQDSDKRIKYYAACFKSRHRALFLLQEAGISVRQIANYQKLQPLHPQQTPLTEGGEGLRHYWKDAQFAQQRFEMTEQLTKQREIAISNKLAVEAMLAARTAVEEGSSGIPLIPPTPSYHNPRQPDMAAEMLKKIQAKKKEKPDRIKVIPAPLVGLLKSDRFKGAKSEEQIFMEELASGKSKDSEDTDEDDNDSDTVQPPAGFSTGSWAPPGSHAPPPPFPAFPPPFPTPAANSHGGPGYNMQEAWAATNSQLNDYQNALNVIHAIQMEESNEQPLQGAPPFFIPSLQHPIMMLPSHPGPPVQQSQQNQQPVPMNNPTSFSQQTHQTQPNQPTQPNHQPAQTNNRMFLGPPPRPTPLEVPRPSPASILRAHLEAPPKKLIQIYLPGHLAPRRAGATATDVLILGHTDASATTLILTHALFLPTTLRMMQRVKDGRAAVVEAYAVGSAAHKAVCEKVRFIWDLVTEGPEEEREDRVTKRWRTGKGAVWEGYGAFLSTDEDMVMGLEQREGRVGFRGML